MNDKQEDWIYCYQGIFLLILVLLEDMWKFFFVVKKLLEYHQFLQVQYRMIYVTQTHCYIVHYMFNHHYCFCAFTVCSGIMEGPRERSVTTPGDLVLTCLTEPSDLPVEWVHWRDLTRTESLLSDDPRATILPISNGSMLTLRNSTPEDSGVIFCRFNIKLAPRITPILGREVVFDVLIIAGMILYIILWCSFII